MVNVLIKEIPGVFLVVDMGCLRGWGIWDLIY
jgi:hypothetical protein